jgi:glycosyltransferase involved in cell wall biosynthesis
MFTFLLTVEIINSLTMLAVSIYNSVSLPSFTNSNASKAKVSVLIPARNEERNIERVLNSCLRQSAVTEIIVYDDCSTDRTAAIVADVASKTEKNLTLISGKELPNDWLGKPHACFQLAAAACGDFLVFIDADVELINDDTLNLIRNYQESNNVDLLSLFPEQETITISEKLVIPLIDVMLYSYLPIKAANRSKKWIFTAANGQFISFSRDSYKKCQGHELVKAEVLEDIRLAQRVKKLGYTVHTASGKGLVKCRMYHNAIEILFGFGKNFYAVGGNSILTGLGIVSCIVALIIGPHIFALIDPLFFIPLSLLLLNRLIIAFRFNHSPIFSLATHGIGFMLGSMIAIFSIFWHTLGQPSWKNRVVGGHFNK